MTVSQSDITGMDYVAKLGLASYVIGWNPLPGGYSALDLASQYASIASDELKRLLFPFIIPDRRTGPNTVICDQYGSQIAAAITLSAAAGSAGITRNTGESDDGLLGRALIELLGL